MPPPNAPRFSATNQPKRRSHLGQLVDMQDVLHAKAIDPATPPKDAAALACAWERLENRRGRLRMKPEPKPVDVTVERELRRRRQAQAQEPSAGPVEPTVLPRAV